MRKERSWFERAKPAPLKTTRDAAPRPQSQLGIDWSSFVHPQRFDGYVREIERYKSRNDSTSYEAVYSSPVTTDGTEAVDADRGST